MAKSLEEQLAEVEAKIAAVEAETKRYLASAEYRDKLSTLKARQKTAEAAEQEAEAHAAKIETAVLCAARIQGHPSDARSVHPDLVAAIERLTGKKPKEWKSLAQPGRISGPQADPVATLITKLRQEALQASPEFRKAHAASEKASQVRRNAESAIWEVERSTPDKDLWRERSLASELRNKIQRRDAAKATATPHNKKAKTETITTRNKVLAIIRGEGEFTW